MVTATKRKKESQSEKAEDRREASARLSRLRRMSPLQKHFFGTKRMRAMNSPKRKVRAAQQKSYYRRKAGKPAAAKRKTTRKTTKTSTNWLATIAAGLGGLAVGGAAGTVVGATHAQGVQGMLNSLASGSIPVISGLAAMAGGKDLTPQQVQALQVAAAQNPALATALGQGVAQTAGTSIIIPPMNGVAPIIAGASALNTLVGQQAMMDSLYGGSPTPLSAFYGPSTNPGGALPAGPSGINLPLTSATYASDTSQQTNAMTTSLQDMGWIF